MKRLIFFASTLSGCLYTGDQTMGLPCNTDLECGGDQLCIEHVCGGVQGSTSSGGSSESSSEGNSAPASDDDSVKESCTPDDTMCKDNDVLQLCDEDGKLSTIGCPGRCGEASPSLGCFPQAPDGPTCYCDNARATCNTEGVLDCLDGSNLGQCTAGYVEPLDCDRVCVDAGYSGSDSCGAGEGNDVCFCNNSCVENSTRCNDDQHAATCFGGSWEIYNCNDLCVENGYSFSLGCLFFYDGSGDSCSCV